MKNNTGSNDNIVKNDMYVGPIYYTTPEGDRVLHAPTTVTQGVKAINAQGTESVSLKDIIEEQYDMLELNIKKDICNLYVSTYGLHGGSIELTGNTDMINVSEYRENMTIVGEVDKTLPYIEI